MNVRRAAAWASVVALLAVAVGFAPWPLSPARVAERLNGAFGVRPQLVWRVPEAVTFSALPWPNLRIVDARVDDALGANLMSAPEAKLDLSLTELVEGRFAPARVFLVTPTVTLNLDRPPFAASATSALVPLASLGLSNGVFRIVSKAHGLDTVIENAHGRNRRARARQPAAYRSVGGLARRPRGRIRFARRPGPRGARRTERVQRRARVSARRTQAQRRSDRRRNAGSRRRPLSLVTFAWGLGSSRRPDPAVHLCRRRHRHLRRDQGDAERHRRSTRRR